MEKEKIFIEGLYSKEVPDTAPDFILGQGAIHVQKLKNFLDSVDPSLVSERGYINWKLLESKNGSRYYELDTWKPKPKESQSEVPPMRKPEIEINGETIPYKDITPDDIPF